MNKEISGNIVISNKLHGKIFSKNTIKGVMSLGVLKYEKIMQVKDKIDLPTVGAVNSLYIIENENAVYRWDEENLLYFCVGRDYEEINVINGGNANGCE